MISFTQKIFLLLLVLVSNQCLLAQDRTDESNTSEAVKIDSTTRALNINQSEDLTKQLTLPRLIIVESKNAILEYRLPFSTIFKYDTSPNNPENKCYEITRPLTKKYTFLFNFMSQQQYTIPDH